MEKKMKHLEMIQGVINRMASNSFLLKGWAVTLVAGIFALSSKDADKLYFLIAYIPILVFWGLDAYYLFQERLYRKLYDKICLLQEQSVDFYMDASVPESSNEKYSFWNCVFSKTELGFYLPLAILSAGIIIITNI